MFFPEKWVRFVCCIWMYLAHFCWKDWRKSWFRKLFPMCPDIEIGREPARAGGHLCRHRSSVSSPSKPCFYVNTISITTVLHSWKDFPSSRKLSSDSIDFSVACEPSMRDCKRMTPVLSLLFFWIGNANVYGQPLNEVSLPIKWLQCSRWAGVSRMNVIRLLLRC